jgi:hypothetical protein
MSERCDGVVKVLSNLIQGCDARVKLTVEHPKLSRKLTINVQA